MPNQRSNRVVLEANRNYWDKERFPRLKRIVFDNTLDQKEAVELVKNGEGLVDLVTGLSPLETLQVARSPFAKVVKARGSLGTIFGRFNMRKVRSPWHDIRLRHAANVAINRTNLIRYAAKGNGVIVPALVPVQGFGYDPNLAPYPFDPDKARHLLREAGYPEGLAITLIASEELTVQATVVSKMLEHVGFQVRLQLLDSATFSRKTLLSRLDQPPEQQSWDIALGTFLDIQNCPAYLFYNYFALDGQDDWVAEQPELRQLYEQILGTVNEGQQVYTSFCAGCHGANLEGQSDWRKRLPMGNFPAPPHDASGHTWHHADQWLFEIVKYGGRHHAPPRYRSAMPTYQDMLSNAEIWAVLAFIKSRWPAAIQAEQEQQNVPNR